MLKLQYNVVGRRLQFSMMRCCQFRYKSKEKEDVITIPSKPTEKEVPSKILRFLLGKYAIYLTKFQKSLANEMPDTARMLSVFTSGLKEFVTDFRDLITVYAKLSTPFYHLRDLTWRELYLYYFMPVQMIKVFPVVALSALPFGQNIVFPIAFWFPKKLLSTHFWDDEQRKEFAILDLKARLSYARNTFRSMQDRIQDIRDPIAQEKCLSVFHSLGSGIHPNEIEICDLRDIFLHEPLGCQFLYPSHMNNLLRLHGLNVRVPLRRTRLKNYSKCLHMLDLAAYTARLEKFSHDQLMQMMILRGGNPIGLERTEMMELLQQWTRISMKMNDKNSSLLLHLPILLFYNHPPNLFLIHK